MEVNIEFFDVVDKNRLPLGYKKSRDESLKSDEFNIGVEIWIINDNSILMTQRSKTKSHPGQWEVPGGCCQAGETSTDTINRETKEEIGIDITEKDYSLIGMELYKKQFVDIYFSTKLINIKEIILQKEEVDKVKFVNKNEFIKMQMNNEIVPSILDRYNKIKSKLSLNWWNLLQNYFLSLKIKI